MYQHMAGEVSRCLALASLTGYRMRGFGAQCAFLSARLLFVFEALHVLPIC